MVSRSVRCAWLALVWTAGCSQVLGFKEARINDGGVGTETGDAAGELAGDAAGEPGHDAPGDGANAPGDGPAGMPTDAGVDAAIDAASGSCVPAACPFGCDPSTDACRPGKLWIFKTQGSFIGNAFGGTDVPINVRGGADGKCLATYSMKYGNRHCNNNRVHAILHVTGADSLELMETTYSIPVDVPVHRAEDDVLVSDNWNDLTSPTKPLHEAATTAATDDEAAVWTGADTATTCASWTSAISTDKGMRGFTNRTDASWLSAEPFRCDRLVSLLCICWSGGD